MKKLWMFFGVLFALNGVISAARQPETITEARTAITQALQSGKISRAEAVRYRANLILARQNNPESFRPTSDQKEKCGTPLWMTIHRDWDLLPGDMQGKLLDIQNRWSTQYTYVTPQHHFKIHYDTDGSYAVYQPTTDDNNNSVPDYVERVGSYFEASWAFLDSLGFDHVPSDGTLGGDSKYDVYMHPYSGAYGVTFPEGSGTTEYPTRNSRYSHINIDPSFSGFPDTPDNNAKVTAVHEFFHAVQFIYNVGTSPWLMETSSTWVEDEKYDGINQYISYLGDVFSNPYLSITSTQNVHEYGNCIWLHHITESKSEDLTRQIWTDCINHSALPAINSALTAYDPQENIGTDFQEYAVWNYFTGYQRGNTNINSYQDAVLFPSVSVYGFHTQYPVEDRVVNSNVFPQGYGANYLRFRPSDSPKQNLLVVLNGEDGIQWHYQVVTKTGTEYSLGTSVDGDASGDANIFIPDWPTISEAVIVITVNQNSNSGKSYSYSAYETDYAIHFENYFTSDSLVGNNNGQLEPGETASLVTAFTNYGQNLTDVDWIVTTADQNITLGTDSLRYSSFNTGQTITNSGEPFTFTIAPNAAAHQVNFLVTLKSGDGIVAQQLVQVLVGYPGLLVVDDENGDDGQAVHDALDELGTIYDSRNLASDSLGNLKLNLRHTLIWTTGDQYTSPLSPEEMDSLSHFLDRGGRLILFGDKILTSNGSSDFVKNYLLAEVDGYVQQSAFMSGIVNDPISRGGYIGVSGAQYPPDMIRMKDSPEISPVWKFAIEKKPGVIKVNADHYRIVFGSMPFGTLNAQNSSFVTPTQMLQRSLNWLADTLNIAPTEVQASSMIDTLIKMRENSDTSLNFRWHPSADVDNEPVVYMVQIDTSSLFPDPNMLCVRDISDTTLAVSDTVFTPLLHSVDDTVTIYWRVFASDYSDVSPATLYHFTATLDTTITGVSAPSDNMPAAFVLYRNYPNPFNPATTLTYALPQSEYVRLYIYNIRGQLVNRLVDKPKEPGVHEIQWNGTNENNIPVSSGVYIVRLVTAHYHSTMKITLLR